MKGTATSSTGFIWCSRRDCWVCAEICRINAYQKAVKKCLACLQLSLFPSDPVRVNLRLEKRDSEDSPLWKRGGGGI